MEPLRADEELVGGMIHKPMFERLILADYAVADLTTANANVFYELGVRHAVRPYSTVLVSADVKRIPFDLAPDRVLPYALDGRGRPASVRQGPRHAGRRAEVRARDLAPRRSDSPVFQLVEGLAQPEIDRLKTDVFRDAGRATPSTVKQRLAAARRADEQDDPGRPCARSKTISARSSDVEAGVLVDLLLSYRAAKAWDDMIRVVEAMPEPVRRTRAGARAVRVRAQPGRPRERTRSRSCSRCIADRGPSSETLRVARPRLQGPLGAPSAKARRCAPRASSTRRSTPTGAGFEADWRDAYPGVNAVTLMEIRDPGDEAQQALSRSVRYANRRRIDGGAADYWDHATRLELGVIARDQDEAQAGARDALASGPRALGAGEHGLQPVADPRRARRAGRADRLGRRHRGRARRGSPRPGRHEGKTMDRRRARARGDRSWQARSRRHKLPRCARSPTACATRSGPARSRTMLHALARRALTDDWDADQRAELAIKVLRDHQQFGYARRLLARVRAESRQRQRATAASSMRFAPTRISTSRPSCGSTERWRSSPTARRRSTTAPTPRRWASRGRSTSAAGRSTRDRTDLENALFCYRRGYRAARRRAALYAGINAAFVADQLAALEERSTRWRTRAGELRDERRRDPRGPTSRRRRPPDDGGWNDATLGEALFGLGRFAEATSSLAAVGRATPRTLWRLETTAMQLAALARLRGFDEDPSAEAALGRARRRPRRRVRRAAQRQGRPGAVGRRVPRLAVSHRRARPARGVRRAAPRRGALVRLRRLDRRRLLLPQAARAAASQAGRRDHGRRTTSRSSRELGERVPGRRAARTCAGSCRQRALDDCADALTALLAHRPRRRAARASCSTGVRARSRRQRGRRGA